MLESLSDANSIYPTDNSDTLLTPVEEREEAMTLDKAKQIRQDYQKLLAEIKAKRGQIKEEYQGASSERKKELVGEAGEYVFSIMTERMFPLWHGTRWDFNGVTEEPKPEFEGVEGTPREDCIACGVFVSTALVHAGFNLSRSGYAQQPSGYIIRNLTSRESIIDFSNSAPVEKIQKKMEEWGKGLYITGLDCHVGFLVNDGENVNFVHSSYYNPPFCVVTNTLDGWNPFAHSKYRMIGKILSDEMMGKWIQGEKFPLVYDWFKEKKK
ncbi:MAG: hypothetical protein ABII01_00260 [Candidatus Woesearchaeota archaeon]